jgi:hypothetical protein
MRCLELRASVAAQIQVPQNFEQVGTRNERESGHAAELGQDHGSQDLGQPDEPELEAAVWASSATLAACEARLITLPEPLSSMQLYGIRVIRVRQAVRDSEAARRPRVVVALHSDHRRRRPDLGDPRE